MKKIISDEVKGLILFIIFIYTIIYVAYFTYYNLTGFDYEPPEINYYLEQQICTTNEGREVIFTYHRLIKDTKDRANRIIKKENLKCEKKIIK